jgi:holliday junction DNA helicase RuvA
MIGWLNGIVRAKRPPSLLLDVGGVGFELEAPMSTFAALPELGQPCELFIHQVIREDANNLFAFMLEGDRDVFRMLLKVNGVGAKIALAILSGMSLETLSIAVHDGDSATLSRLPGIGKKTADRLIIEMRDRLKQLPQSRGVSLASGSPSVAPKDDPVAEAINALIALGYKPPEASQRVAALEKDDLAVEEIVRRALQASLK